MAFTQPLHVLYDGQCRFCLRSLRIARALDVMHRLRYYDANDRELVASRFPALQGADFDQAMYLVTERGKAYRGFFAFRRITWSMPLAWPLLPLFFFPGAGTLGPRVYSWIARHRRNLGCAGPVCTLPNPLKPPNRPGAMRR